ncbi:hypothetical protein [Pantoea vagans]|uniref:hypothetical protein n=1 Tax=Pantoea vagans TaxID=470934 RepID=UPI0028B0B91C|nr:hypothetical protein [Pantoea vagans]
MGINFEGGLSISKNKGDKTITLVNESNEKITLTNVVIVPLGYKETELFNGQDNGGKTIPLRLKSYKASSENFPKTLDSHGSISKLEIETNWSLKIIAITEGGWIPAGMTPNNAHYLLDKNIFNILNTRYINGELKDNTSNDFFDLITSDNLIINPSLFMLEGNNQSLERTSNDLRNKYTEATALINKALPTAAIPFTRDELVSATSGMLSQLYSSNSKKLLFIKSVIPILYKETSKKKRSSVITQIKNLAMTHEIRRNEILFIAALSAALSSSKQNPAKKIFKPKPPENYTNKDAYNTLSDFRALDYLMWAIALDYKTQTYLCTNDKNLIKFWCAIEPNNFNFQGNLLSYNLKFKENLFGNLNDIEYEWVLESME